MFADNVQFLMHYSKLSLNFLMLSANPSNVIAQFFSFTL